MSEEKKTIPAHRQIWRKMNTMEYYPGQYSVSDAAFLQFNASISYLYDFMQPETPPHIQVRYSVGGDQIGELHCRTIEEAIAWLRRKWNQAIEDNRTALESPKDIQIEET